MPRRIPVCIGFRPFPREIGFRLSGGAWPEPGGGEFSASDGVDGWIRRHSCTSRRGLQLHRGRRHLNHFCRIGLRRRICMVQSIQRNWRLRNDRGRQYRMGYCREWLAWDTTVKTRTLAMGICLILLLGSRTLAGTYHVDIAPQGDTCNCPPNSGVCYSSLSDSAPVQINHVPACASGFGGTGTVFTYSHSWSARGALGGFSQGRAVCGCCSFCTTSGVCVASYDGNIVISGPAGQVDVSANLVLQAYFENSGFYSGSLGRRVFVAGTFGSAWSGQLIRDDCDSWCTPAGTTYTANGILSGSNPNGTTFTTPTVNVATNTPIPFSFQIRVQGFYNFVSSITSSHTATLSFQEGVAFNLPPGYTVDSNELNIFDNHWNNPYMFDVDADGKVDFFDNCPSVSNPDQADADSDGVGDICDICPSASDPSQADTDNDGHGDACDNCPANTNANQADTDTDGVGDVCDNCPNTPNPGQEDADSNGIGDACEGLTGACCQSGGVCSDLGAAACAAIPLATFRGDGTTCPPTPGCPMPGDPSGEGTSNGEDAQCFVACYVGQPSTCACAGADMDADGDIDINDLRLFVCHLLGISPGSCP